MADHQQKTEKASPRRIAKARRDGMFISSAELLHAVGFGTGVMVLVSLGPWWWERLQTVSAEWLLSAFRLSRSPAAILWDARSRLLALALPVVGALAVVLAASVTTQMFVTGFGWSSAKLTPDLTRLNPMTRLKQLPAQNLYQLLRAAVLLPLVAVVLGLFITGLWADILTLPLRGLNRGVAAVVDWFEWLLWRAAATLLILGIIDWIRQRIRYFKQLRMSKQEVKEEFKEMEGNAQVKARIRRMQRDMARRRSISQVPTASVVVVNPTHYAVAIRYVQAEMMAPKVVAKGKNAFALKIRKLATEREIPIVENPPLAQALYKSAEVGFEIPPAFYRAVAEVLAYIYRVTQGRLHHGVV